MAKKTFTVAKPNLILKVGVVPTKMKVGTEYKAETKNVEHLVRSGRLVLASKAKVVEAPEEDEGSAE